MQVNKGKLELIFNASIVVCLMIKLLCSYVMGLSHYLGNCCENYRYSQSRYLSSTL